MSNVVAEYKDIERKDEVTRGVRKLRRKFFRYKEAEYVYSIEHKKLLELADKAGAIYRVDGFVLIEREMTHFMGHNHNRIFLTARIQPNEADIVGLYSSIKC